MTDIAEIVKPHEEYPARLDSDINAVYQAIKGNYETVNGAWDASVSVVKILASRWENSPVLHELQVAGNL